MADPEDSIVKMIRASISLDSRTPRFEQVERAIEKAIEQGALEPGEVLPREPDLATGLGLSRQTVGRALNELANRGLVIRRRGVGTFVAEKPIEQPLDHLYSFVRTLAKAGKPSVAHVLGVRVTVDEDASAALTGDSAGLVLEIGRLFFVEDLPVVLEYTFLPLEIGERLPIARLAGGVIDDLLREICGVNVDRGEEVLSLASLTRPAAAHLRLKLGAPAFSILRSAYAGDRLVQVRRSLVRGDRARFRVQLAGRSLAAAGGEVAPRIELPDAS